MKRKVLNNIYALNVQEAVDYKVKLVLASFGIRFINLLAGTVFILMVRVFPDAGVKRAALLVFSAWIITCLVYSIPYRLNLLKTEKSVENVHFSYYVFGLFYTALIVHYLGGAEGIAFYIYFFELMNANLLLGRLKGFFVTIVAGLSYYMLVLLEFRGVIPHYNILIPDFSHDSIQYLLSHKVLGIGIFFILISYSMSLFSKIWAEREKKLSESKKSFLKKFQQMEEIALALKKKIAENKYLKTVTMGYIGKKEFELSVIRKDLEEQIEKLRKTQKSMFFMIEDLNMMRSELKDARDHLEEKVMERTEELLSISQKMHRSERLAFLGKLAGSITHELRNPLAVLRNAVFVFKKRFQNSRDEKTLKYIDTVENQLSVINSIIDDVMGFAKTKPVELEKADINEILREAVSQIDVPEFIEIKKETKKLPIIEIDISQVMQALTNIINNAIMAMSGNGVLTLRTKKEKTFICVEIVDTGPGIPLEQRELIFEPLYSNKTKGTGLGLPLAKMMIKNQEGHIDFESQVGVGTGFQIYLPITRGHKKEDNE